MTRRILCFALCICAGASVLAAEPIVVYERHYVAVEMEDNAMTMKLYEDGTLKLHYPPFMRMAGDYKLTLSESEKTKFLNEIEAVGGTRLNQEKFADLEKQSRSSVAVFDVDRVTFSMIKNGRAVSKLQGIPDPIAISSKKSNNPDIRAFVLVEEYLFDNFAEWSHTMKEAGHDQ